jgi:uncharacterized protein YlzI (FlbEa/FlbD family)
LKESKDKKYFYDNNSKLIKIIENVNDTTLFYYKGNDLDYIVKLSADDIVRKYEFIMKNNLIDSIKESSYSIHDSASTYYINVKSVLKADVQIIENGNIVKEVYGKDTVMYFYDQNLNPNPLSKFKKMEGYYNQNISMSHDYYFNISKNNCIQKIYISGKDTFENDKMEMIYNSNGSLDQVKYKGKVIEFFKYY